VNMKTPDYREGPEVLGKLFALAILLG
jgi:hypothetical protein